MVKIFCETAKSQIFSANLVCRFGYFFHLCRPGPTSNRALNGPPNGRKARNSSLYMLRSPPVFRVALHAKFKTNRIKNDIFVLWAYLGPTLGQPWAHPQNHGHLKSSNIDADSYSACYNRPTNQIGNKLDEK